MRLRLAAVSFLLLTCHLLVDMPAAAYLGSTGTVITPIRLGQNRAKAVVRQPDGKLVAAGYTVNNTNNAFVLVRYNPDGSLDSGFGTSGIVLLPLGIANALLLQPDGKLVVGGNNLLNGAGSAHFTLARFNANGTLDTSFGVAGTTTTAIDASSSITALVLQADDKIVAAGVSRVSSYPRFALARYQSNGAVDTTYGIGGAVTTTVHDIDDVINAMVIQPNGYVVVAGSTFNVTESRFVLARYTDTGTPDAAFGSGGVVETRMGENGIASYANGLALLPDGRLVAGGELAGDSAHVTTWYALARYLGDGTLDTTFGSGGKVITQVGSYSAKFNALARAADGKLVAAGYSTDGVKEQFTLVRYSAEGVLDPSFGDNGRVATGLGDNATQAEAHALVQQADGMWFAVGEYQNLLSYDINSDCFLAVRYTADGVLDGPPATPTPVIPLGGAKLLVYPNPGRGHLTLAYPLLGAAQATIDIFTISGDRVARLKEPLTQGGQRTQTTRWDCSGVAPGIYLARLKVVNSIGTVVLEAQRKVAVVR